MQRLREGLVIGLIVLLPFHAFGVTVLTRLIAGPGHAPLAALAMWKEAVLAIVLMLSLIEVVQRTSLRIAQRQQISIDRIDRLVWIFVLLGLVLTALHFHSWGALFHGARYTLLPLAVLGVAKLVPWSRRFAGHVLLAMCVAGTLVAALGILSFFVPQQWFSVLGYSDLHSLYVPNGPLAPFQQLGGSALRRVQGVMSGPNQLGIWLLLPLSLLLPALFRVQQPALRFARVATLFIMLACLLLTFSRAAWVAAAVMAVFTLFRLAQPRTAQRLMALGALLGALLMLAIWMAHPEILLRAASTRGHVERPLQALQSMAAEPFGRGLGMAGPASNRISDACVFLEPGADIAWTQPHRQLCVFVGAQQIQPQDRACTCPLLPENWYLQVGIETGVFGLLVFLALLAHVWKRLASSAAPLALSAQLSLLGIGVAALFLHAWEDAAVAYTFWLLTAASLAPPEAQA